MASEKRLILKGGGLVLAKNDGLADLHTEDCPPSPSLNFRN